MLPAAERIGGYRIERLIARTNLSEVYLGRDARGLSVCLKRPRPELAAPGSVTALSFRREARLLAEVTHPNVVRVIEIGEHEGTPFSCLELVEGESLERRMREGRVPILDALEILRQIAVGLGHVHDRRLVHGDLKPANVLLGAVGRPGAPNVKPGLGAQGAVRRPGAPNVKLVDFGLASYAGIKRDRIDGTPHYMAPEQTGLVDWPIDGRTDLYSFGVIAFELFAGQLPFPLEDPAALIAAHVSKSPPALSAACKDAPPVLERIISKLLEKNPARRYRSAHGLAHDIGLLAERLRAGDPSPTFPLDATGDLTERVGQVFVGRAEDLAELESLLARALHGRPQTVFVSGAAGIGKSTLIHELQNRSIATGARFAAGKCYEFARALPYHVFSEALTDHLARGESAPGEVREREERRIRGAVGELGAELVKIAPAFSRIFPDAGAAAYLGEGRDRVRLLQMLSRLLEALAPVGSPLVLLLEDLQWADSGTLQALETIAFGARDASLLVLGTFRPDEVPADHPLRKVVEGAGVRHITLRPFDRALTALMVAESLRQPVSALDAAIVDGVWGEGRREATRSPIVDKIHERTAGNPLFVSEVVKALLASGALRVEAGQLRTSLARLEETDLPTSIVDMVLRRVSDLDATTRRVLGAAALVGTDFTLDLVASAAASPREDVFAALDVGVAQRILHPPRDDTYRFQHDRMREACARLVQDGADVHERIVRWLELQEGAADSDEFVFALAEHASRAGDDARSFRRCRDAAERALARHANQQALEYDRRALAHGARSGVPGAELRAVREQMADILTQLGRYDEARAIYEELLAGATDAAGDDRRARLLSRRGGCELRAGDLAGASATLGEALSLLGRRIPRRAGALAMLGARLRLWLSRLRTAIVGPVVADERRRITLDILVRLWLVLFVSDVKRVPYVSYRLLAESVPLGPSMELSRAHRHLTVALALLPRPAWKRAIRHGMRAIAIAQRASAPLEAAIAMLYTSDIFCWSARYREALPWLESAREKLAALGNMWELANTHIFSYMAYRGCGRLDDAMAHAQAMVRLGERLNASGTVANGHVKVAEILVLRGDAAGAESHLSRGLEIAEERKLNFERFQGYKIRAFARMLEGRFADARALYAAAIKLCETPGVSFFHGYVSDAYLGYAEAYLKDADYFAASGGLSGEEGRRAARYIADSLARERHLLGHLGYAYRARGLLLWRARRYRASRRAFLRAIEVLEGQERVIDVALAALDAAAALGAHFQVEALSWVKRARAIADKLRLKPVRSRCDEAMRDLGHEVAGAPAAGDGAVRALHALRELVGTSHLLMQARDPELLLERIVDASLSLLGAERAFLFIREEGGGRELAFRLGKSADGRHVSEVDARVSRSVLERVDTLGKGLAVSDTEQDQSLRERGSVQAFQVRSVLCAPLLQAGSPLGVLYLDSQITKAIFGQPELELLQSFAAQAAAALASTRQFATIERMNRELDGKVLERTRELEAANLKLEASMAELKNTTLRLAEAKREALEKELEVARRIQLSMVPGRRTVEAAAARFAGVVEPASLCGGDLWTYAEAQGDKLVLFVGDVTGHGAGAAMITTVAKSCLDTMWLEHAGKLPVEQLCATLNAVISRLAGGELMMTAFVVEIDPSRRVLSYCSAGHNPQLLVRAGAGQPEIVALFERGMRIGDAAGADFRVKTVTYQAGDRLVLYTDGLVERTDPAGTEYGTRRLQRALRARAALGAAEMLDAILDDVSAFAAGRPADDDVTLVVAELL